MTLHETSSADGTRMEIYLEVDIYEMVAANLTPAIRRLFALASESNRISYKLAALAVLAKQLEEKKLTA